MIGETDGQIQRAAAYQGRGSGVGLTVQTSAWAEKK